VFILTLFGEYNRGVKPVLSITIINAIFKTKIFRLPKGLAISKTQKLGPALIEITKLGI